MPVKHPFGAATVAALSATGAQAITISDNVTYIDGVTTQATGNRTINLTIPTTNAIATGARIFLASKTAATETTIAGTGITMPTITGVAGKTKVTELVYNGTNFIATSAGYQID
jgi:hypothetical protein